MKRKGRMMYVPPNVIEEIDNIMKRDNLVRKSDAFNSLTKQAKVGKELECMRDKFLMLDLFGNKKNAKKR